MQELWKEILDGGIRIKFDDRLSKVKMKVPVYPEWTTRRELRKGLGLCESAITEYLKVLIENGEVTKIELTDEIRAREGIDCRARICYYRKPQDEIRTGAKA